MDLRGDAGNRGAHSKYCHARLHRRAPPSRKSDPNAKRHGQFQKRKSRNFQANRVCRVVAVITDGMNEGHLFLYVIHYGQTGR